MTPEQLITFATVAEHGNISHAALALHLSQPAVSGQLKLLQEAFGEPLYQRAGRGVRLTAAGEQLLAHAERLRETFRQAQALREAMRGLERGTLRIGASTTPASYLLPYLIADFHARYPEVLVTTSHGNTAEIVEALGSLDIALIEGPPGQELPLGTQITPWREDEIVAIVPAGHPLADDQQPLEALGRYPLVLREGGSGVRQIVERAFARNGVAMRVALEIAGVEGVKEAVRAGMGIGFVSAMSIRHEDGALRRVRIGPQPLIRRFSILLPHAATPSRAAARFMELCVGPFAEG
ncbi:LysR family transcriptional regulator [Pseudomonas putida]|uniref:LysR family transcriptional regulator n=1 Tax=Pseudomonas putida TaxID=303 RepID=A0A7W2L179_PSEPU|nr:MULTISPECIES: LysR substrate-binding domain-containing protein [Pseudomonas]MBA6116644.1 LysR family transcriptional regulator [Pseudomonas putida]MBI6942834.1 LysR family transcriptional regulator [Pseudomonas putida]MBI6960613.1 LysR family transcriptional regulator [Pseudomonas putida]MCZ9637404.1 LysR family transcriptional regulator [Pseudomonas putida]MEC4876892.1 LysR substrate-binding domain-containing protein [Pseudomonas sp. NC26]